MKTVRITPRAINKPLAVCGIERKLFGVLMIVCGLIATETYQLLGIGLFFVLAMAAQKMSRKDPNLLMIGRQLWKLHPVYDPIKREPFEMRIE